MHQVRNANMGHFYLQEGLMLLFVLEGVLTNTEIMIGLHKNYAFPFFLDSSQYAV